MKEAIYLPNLNSIRCIAASLVIIHHTEQIKHIFNIENVWSNPCIRILGSLGVVLFFVLSGFLITYLLLKEQSTSGTVSIRKFYVRRILRIWPLYYLIVLLSFFILPYFAGDQLYATNWQLPAGMRQQLLLYILLVPNFAVTLGLVPYATQLWSVGVEEQFYLVWPWLMKWSKNRAKVLLTICLIIIGVYTIVPLIFTEGLWPLRIKKILSLIPVNCMAIGALMAVVVSAETKILMRVKALLFHRAMQVIALTVLLVMMIKGITFPELQNTVYSVLFAIIIGNLACNTKRIINLEYSKLNRLGQISYGMYMYHPLMIVIAIKLLSPFQLEAGINLHLLSFALTIFISGISYRYFEQFFLSLKSRFTVVVSGDNTLKQEDKA